MGIYYNGLTSAKKLLNKRNPYVKAYVGENLVHTGTELTNYIDWKISGSYLVFKASKPISSSLNIQFEIVFQHRIINNETGETRTTNTYEQKHTYYPEGYNSEETLYLSPDRTPSIPSGFVYNGYRVMNVRPYYMSPTSDELYSYKFRAAT